MNAFANERSEVHEMLEFNERSVRPYKNNSNYAARVESEENK